MDTRHVVVDTLLGKITLVASGESVVGLVTGEVTQPVSSIASISIRVSMSVPSV